MNRLYHIMMIIFFVAWIALIVISLYKLGILLL